MTQLTPAHPAPIDHPRRALWDRFFWQLAEGRFPDPKVTEQTLLSSPDLHALAGDEIYTQLVTWAADGHSRLDMREIFEALFPRRCFCRRQGAMDYYELDFSGTNVYRRIYYSDPCIDNSCDVLFHRTRDIDLLQCRECGDLWLRGMDQDWGRQHLLLLEPGDLERIEAEGIWPSGLDQAEATWIAAVTGIAHDDPRIPAWQRETNSPEAMQRFGTKLSE